MKASGYRHQQAVSRTSAVYTRNLLRKIPDLEELPHDVMVELPGRKVSRDHWAGRPSLLYDKFVLLMMLL